MRHGLTRQHCRRLMLCSGPLGQFGSFMLVVGAVLMAAPICAQVGAQNFGVPAGLEKSTELGFAIFQQTCLSCHGNPAVERAPSPAALREFPPERIYAALTSGVMKTVGDALTDLQRRQVAESVSGRLLGSTVGGDAQSMVNRCTANPPIAGLMGAPGWNGWGLDLANTRYQPASQAGLDATMVPALKLKWVFGLPNATSSYSQPTVMAGRVFVGADTGYVYSLDTGSGCVYWSYQSKSGVRNAPVVAPFKDGRGTRFAVYYGDLKANVYALDAQTGALLWTRRVEPHYTDRVTASPTYYRGRLYVPISSWEEFSASSPDYPCCTSVGNVVALDADTGRQIWKTYVIPSRPQPVRKNARGVQQWAPAGGSVWNTPTIDPKRRAIYFGTGDATTFPAASTTDAVMALNMDTGKVLWSYQIHKNDSFLGGCNVHPKPDNCPEVVGPDWDIPASVILRSIAGNDRLIVGTKPGDILALDPANHGKPVWRINVHGPVVGNAPGPSNGGQGDGVRWGGAADSDTVYYGLSGGDVAAVDIADGHLKWLHRTTVVTGTAVSHAAAASVIPGVVFVGGSDGILSAMATADGHVLWQFDTHRTFDSVNHVPTKGGSISVPGATIAAGMVFVASGYSVIGGMPGNAVLAFGVDSAALSVTTTQPAGATATTVGTELPQ